MSTTRINLPGDAVAQLCIRYGIRRLSLFGSVLRTDFRPDSDVDVLVEFFPETRIGLIGVAAIQRELTDLVGRPVDVRTPADLSQYFRDEVLREAVEQYAA